VESGVLDDSGNVTLMEATADNSMIVIRAAGGSAQTLFQAGDAVGVQVPSLLAGFARGSGTGNPVLLTGGSRNSSIAEWRDGGVRPLLSPGDQILGGDPFAGIDSSGAQRTANGDLYARISGTAIARYAAGAWDTALGLPIVLDDGLSAVNVSQFAVNNNGAIAWTGGTNKGGSPLFLTQNGQHQLVCASGLTTQPPTVIDGHEVTACLQYVLDDNGRLAATVFYRNESIQRIAVWNNGNWQVAVDPFRTRVGGFIVTGSLMVRAAGAHIFGVLQSGGGNILAEWTDAGWSVVYTPNDRVPTGSNVAYVYNLESNSKGDFVFTSTTPGVGFGIYSRRAGVLSTVLTTGRRTGDGDYVISILGVNLQEDGTIYLLLLNEKGELVFYQAAPI
jgi:hypothetical protein